MMFFPPMPVPLIKSGVNVLGMWAVNLSTVLCCMCLPSIGPERNTTPQIPQSLVCCGSEVFGFSSILYSFPD